MELEYIRAGDYLLPAITLRAPPDEPPLGYYGERHKTYLREHRAILYSQLLLSERLYPLCREVDETARERRHRGVPEEVTLSELVYN